MRKEKTLRKDNNRKDLRKANTLKQEATVTFANNITRKEKPWASHENKQEAG